MTIQPITTKLISTLGNKESLVPIMIKDSVDSLSLTCKSYKEGGKIEGRERLTDEFGTQAIWIGGIPFFKKLIDKTAYKVCKINPDVDPRIISNKEYADWAIENAQGIMNNSKQQSVKDALIQSVKDGGKKAKNLFKFKICAATILTLTAYFLMTKAKQKNTKNTVIKEMHQKINEENKNNNTELSTNIFSEFDSFYTNKTKQPAFKGVINKTAEAIMFNPVHNMKIIDAGITTERLACSRNKTEFFEHAIKEGGFLFFIYGFGNLLEKGINKFAKDVLKTPIDLPIDAISCNEFKTALSGNKIINDVLQLPNKDKSLKEKLDFIKNNPDNIIIQCANKAKFVALNKNSEGKSCIDTSKYIDTNAIEKLKNQLLEADKNYKQSGLNINAYINKTKALKILSVAANIGVSCLFLGYIIPKMIYKYRASKTGTTKFHVEEEIRNNEKAK